MKNTQAQEKQQNDNAMARFYLGTKKKHFRTPPSVIRALYSK